MSFNTKNRKGRRAGFMGLLPAVALAMLLAAIAGLPKTVSASSAGFDIPIPSQSTTEAATGAEPIADFSHPDDWEISDDLTIAEGIYAEGINLGGMTPSQATEAIDDYYSNIMMSVYSLEASADTIYKTTLKELGFSYNITGVVEEAAYLGTSGLLTDRYMKLQDLKHDKVVLPVSYSMDRDKVVEYISTNIAANDVPSQDGAITRVDGKFVITPSVTGVVTDVEATADGVMDMVSQGLKLGMSSEVIFTTDEPAITGEALQTVKDLLGTYSTYYGDSASGRKTNVNVGSANINGTLLMPGEQISVSEAMKERSAANGYQVAGEYVDGATVSAIGGGVCQVATTLYQAALQAELQIVKRYNHSMLVYYVEPSFDSAISWGNKDLVIANNTENPVYIEAITDDVTVTFNIYGKEYRASNRTIVYENVIVERIVSETQIKEDPTQPVGYEVKTGSNHDACTSYLVKKVYIDGVLTETVKFKEDTYSASYEVITRGTLGAEPSTEAPSEGSTEATGGEGGAGSETGGETGGGAAGGGETEGGEQPGQAANP